MRRVLGQQGVLFITFYIKCLGYPRQASIGMYCEELLAFIPETVHYSPKPFAQHRQPKHTISTLKNSLADASISRGA